MHQVEANRKKNPVFCSHVKYISLYVGVNFQVGLMLALMSCILFVDLVSRVGFMLSHEFLTLRPFFQILSSCFGM